MALHIGGGLFAPKISLLEVVKEFERMSFVQAMTGLVAQAKGLDVSLYTIRGSKMVNGTRVRTLRFPEDLVSVVLGKISPFFS